MTTYYLDCNNSIQSEASSGFYSFFNKITNSQNYKIVHVFGKVLEAKNGLFSEMESGIHAALSKKYKLESSCFRYFQNLFHSALDSIDYKKNIKCLTEIVVNFKKEFKRFHKTFQKDTAARKLSKKIIKIAKLKKKLSDFKLDVELAEDCYSDIKYLFKTDLIRSIIGFQKSTEAGKIDHALKKESISGRVCLLIKKEGCWVSVQSIKEQFYWDNDEKMHVSKDNASERWNYFHKGLVPVDRYLRHDELDKAHYPEQNIKLHPVVQLSHEEKDALLEHAKSFSKSDQPNEYNAVVQFVTNPRPIISGSFFDNPNSQLPVHCGMRLIMADGSVYSTGFGSTLLEDEWSKGVKIAATINGQPTNLDYEEFCEHEGRIVTSIPLTSERADSILETLNKAREKSIRYNFLNQNCIELGVQVLKRGTGVDLNVKVPFRTCASRLLPSLKSIPLVGRKINSVWLKGVDIVDSISSALPDLVKKILSVVYSIIMYIPRNVGTVVVNLCLCALGACKASPARNLDNDYHEDLRNVKQLIDNPFIEDITSISHSSVFINWQLQQSSTFVHEYKGLPAMNILPSIQVSDCEYSKKQLKRFKKMYKHSTPIHKG